MLTRDLLVEASKRGLLQEAQIAPLWEFLSGKDPANWDEHDPEEMHFARGFHDIFISIGLIILFAGYLVGTAFLADGSVQGWAIALVGATGLTWLLAEWFSKRLRLSLPSILLAGAFTGFSFFAADTLLSTFTQADYLGWMGAPSAAEGLDELEWFNGMPLIFCLAALWGFYKRFAIPITPAMMAVAGVGLCFFILSQISADMVVDYLSLWLLLVGLGCLALALWFDTRDPSRLTIRSDKAFWLHLLAAPLLVHSILSNFTSLDDGALAAFATIALVLLIGLFALIIDRRAFLAAAIGYLGVAIGVLLDSIDLGEAGVISLTLAHAGPFCADARLWLERLAPPFAHPLRTKPLAAPFAPNSA